MKVQYNFYATLLDAFQNYLSNSEIYQQYYGFSENPKLTEDEFEQEQFQGLIDRINRVPFESEPADKGTAFNEVIDCIIENRKSESWDIISKSDNNVIIAGRVKEIDGEKVAQTFDFNLSLSVEIAKYLKGALTQQRVEAILPTQYGNVNLYGYIDQLMPFKVVDLKTTKSYKAFKYRNNWQHKVYPYCLIENGTEITQFEYVITDFKKVYTEIYNYDTEKDLMALKNHCEQFIEFLNEHKNLITDKKIFNDL